MAYATLEDLMGRLDWTLDADEERIASSALDDASALASHYGRDWPEASVPAVVRTLVLRACKRYMSNPDGYTQSRAGDETLAWNDAAGESAGTVYFTREEQDLLAELGGNRRRGLISAPVMGYSSRPVAGTGYVPVDHGSPFPFYAIEGEPW